MIPEKKTIIIEGLQEFFQAIDSTSAYEFFKPNSKGSMDTLWFRGHSDMKWHLEPTLYRKVKKSDKTGDFWIRLKQAEEATYEEFEVRNYHFLNRPPQKKYLWLSLMQHYNMVTRLMDWSEHAIPALFFAVSEYFKSEPPINPTLPCIWVLKPEELSFHSIKLFNETSPEKYPEPDGSIVSLLRLPENSPRQIIHDTVPMPVLAPHTNDRLHAQSGVFTIFPLEGTLTGMLWAKDNEYYLETCPNAEEFLQKIVIVNPKHVSDQLKQIGSKLSMFFPEIPNVSREIQEKYLREIKK